MAYGYLKIVRLEDKLLFIQASQADPLAQCLEWKGDESLLAKVAKKCKLHFAPHDYEVIDYGLPVMVAQIPNKQKYNLIRKYLQKHGEAIEG
jgi:hypothetical protein